MYSFTATTSDPKGLNIKYGWDWDEDGTVDEWSGWKSSGSSDTRQHSWSDPGSYEVRVKARNKGSQESGWGVHTILIKSAPPNDPSAPSGPTSGDHNTQYTYTTSTTDPEGDQIYYWFDWDDGTNSGWVGPYASGATASASHTWSAPGNYDTRVKAKDVTDAESGWSNPTTVTMLNSPPPVPDTPSGPTSGVRYTSYTYSTNAVTDPEGDSVQYLFDWGDGTNSGWITGTSASHSWNAVGTYDVKVKSRDNWDESGWSSPLSVDIENQPPDTPATPSGPTLGKTGQVYRYSTTGSDPDGDMLEYLFDWGDGSNSGWGSSGETHAWSVPSTYQVKVKSRDNWDESGWSNSLSVTIEERGPKPDAGGPYYACTGEEIQFEGSCTKGKPPYTWEWDFGDGKGTSREQNPTYTYEEEGNYLVTLTVTDTEDEEGEDHAYVYVLDCDKPNTNAGGPYYGIVNQEIQFTGSVIGGTSPYTWLWDFGDGETSTQQNPTHTYTTANNYTVTLTVTDDGGFESIDTTWALIEDNNAPDTPTITGPTSGTAGEEYEYTFTISDPDGDSMYIWVEWFLDDPSAHWEGPHDSGEEITLTHTYDEEGTYIIRAKTKDVYDAESDWGTLEVSMPKGKSATLTRFYFLQRLTERFPLFERLLSLPFFHRLVYT
jgi:PKD repeat protein